mmetsp:Transcript_50345/g.81317  ORF Transcript_50345/g.81317 Transcript_50345/m.81317 type:complete len:81 (+) Transcript_50345:1654-1896(+)
MQHIATHYNTLQHTAALCNTLQHPATHCSTLQYTAAHRNTDGAGGRKYLQFGAALILDGMSAGPVLTTIKQQHMRRGGRR